MTSPPAPRWLRWVNGLLVVLILLLMGLSGASLASYLQNPEEYHFGTEVGGILYRSSQHYTAILLIESLVLAGVLALSFFTRAPVRRMWLRLSVVLLDGLFVVGLLPTR
jgi:hypothetical protein